MQKTPLGTKRLLRRKSTKKEKIRKVLVIPDLQIPYHDKESLRAVLKYMDDEKFDELVQLGDFMDFDEISSYNKENFRGLENKRILADYFAGNEVLDEFQKRVSKITLIQGNHDFRIEKYIDSNPQIEGLLEFETQLKLKERGINYVKFWEKGAVYKIGKASFIHGIYTNDLHAKKHALHYGTNIFYGHLHDVQGYSQVLRGDDSTIVGQSLGCLCRYDQQYMKGKPQRWQQAFGIFYFLPDGYFSYFVVRIFKHRFVSPEGRVYK